MAPQRTAFLLGCILILAAFFRFYNLPNVPPGLYPDEAMNGSNALEAIATGNYKVYYPENNGREGLFMNIQAQSLRLFMPWNEGLTEPWMLRIVSALFGFLTVLGIYFLAKELFGRSTGLFASLFLALSFWHIMFSRIGFRAITAPFFLIWAAYFFLASLRPENSSRRTLFFAGLGGVSFGLGFYSYIAYRVAPLLFLLFIPFYRSLPSFKKAALVFLVITFLVALPIGIYYLQNPADFLGRTSQVSIFSAPHPLADLGRNILKTLAMFHFVGDWNARHNYPGQPQLDPLVGFFLLLGLAAAFRAIASKTTIPETALTKLYRFSYLFLLLWFVLMLLPVVVSNEGLPHALRAILLLPPVIILAARGAQWLLDFFGTRLSSLARTGIVAFVALMLAVNTYITYFIRWPAHPDTAGGFSSDYVALGREIRALPVTTPKYVVVEAGGVNVRGIPMPSQTVMFLTDSFTPAKQEAKNIHYLTPDTYTLVNMPANARVFRIK